MIQILNRKDIDEMIRREKNLFHKQLSIKINQFEVFENRRPQIYLQTKNIAEIEKSLLNDGYQLERKTTNKSVTTTMRKDKTVYKSRKLSTTNLVISW